MIETNVKINNIQNLSDARYCSALGVRLLGFKIEASSQEENLLFFQSISEWVAGVEFVAETNFYDKEIVKKGFQYIEVTSFELIKQYSGSGLKLIFNSPDLDIYSNEELFNNDVAYIILPQKEAVALKESIEKYPQEKILVNADHLTKEEVIELTRLYPEIGISITGGEESRPGFKDYDEFSEILEALEN